MPTLDWIGKKAVLNHHNEVPFRLLKCRPELSVGDPGSGNLLIQGDNLEALKALLPYYAGKVKCIYIDPPYNTGNENWIYNDAVNSPEMKAWLGKVVGKEAEDLSRHDKWLCMMYPRLSLLKQFLSADGVLWVSIDDSSVTYLRIMLDEIFGKQNFIACFVWQKRRSPDNDENFATSVHDYIVCYSKKKSACRLNRLARTPEADARYRNPDSDPRGVWTSSDITRREYRAHDYYPITLPSGRAVTPAAGRSWAMPRESFEALKSENRIYFGPRGDSMPRLKRFLTDVSDGIVPTTWWESEMFGDNQSAKRELRLLLADQPDIFPTPKPTKLIERILEISTDSESIVLDSFCGSGTTGQAVISLNRRTSGKRRYVLVELDPEVCENVARARLASFIDQTRNELKSNDQLEDFGLRFCILANPLFTSSGDFCSAVSFSDLAHHVFFTETGEPLPKPNHKKSPLLGIANGVAVYLLYNGILQDKSPNGGNALTTHTLELLPKHAGPKVIYGTSCRLSASRLKRENITFRQIPYQVKVR